MPRTVRDARLESRAARERLSPRHEPYWRQLYEGAHLGYRKGKRGGVWLARWRPFGGRYQKITLGLADDTEDANGRSILDYRQAQDAARIWCEEKATQGDRTQAVGPYTVQQALEDYFAEYEGRGGKAVNDARRRASASRVTAQFGKQADTHGPPIRMPLGERAHCIWPGSEHQHGDQQVDHRFPLLMRDSRRHLATADRNGMAHHCPSPKSPCPWTSGSRFWRSNSHTSIRPMVVHQLPSGKRAAGNPSDRIHRATDHRLRPNSRPIASRPIITPDSLGEDAKTMSRDRGIIVAGQLVRCVHRVVTPTSPINDLNPKSDRTTKKVPDYC